MDRIFLFKNQGYHKKFNWYVTLMCRNLKLKLKQNFDEWLIF